MFWIALFLIIGVLTILFASRKSHARKDDDTVDDISNSNVEIEYVDDFPEDIVNVPGHEFLYYSINTRNVYKVFVKDDIEFLDVFTNNGHLCKYLGGRIMEVVNDEIIAIVHTATLPN